MQGELELLRTPRLVLRRLTFDDGPAIVELDSDPEVVRWVGMPSGETTTLEIWQERLWPKTLAFYDEGPKYGFWAVHTRDDDSFIGWFHYRPLASISEDP